MEERRVKLLMSWDVRPGMDQEAYFEFMMSEFIPQITRMGLEPTDYWYTMYGDRPQFLTAATAIDRRHMGAVLDSTEWEQLEDKLNGYILNLEKRVVPARTGFQL